MRQVNHAGEKPFVACSGKKPAIVDRKTGEVIEVELFVAVLGESNYTFAEATATQQIRNGSARTCAASLLVIDDFAIAPVTDVERRHLLELLEDRYGTARPSGPGVVEAPLPG